MIDVNDCWLYAGFIEQGYGVISSNGKSYRAHRVMYENLVGPIPEGLVIDHLCRVRHCINPAHLEPVTNAENILRGISPSAINAKKTHCIRGHAFTEENTVYYTGEERSCIACNRLRWEISKARRRQRAQSRPRMSRKRRCALTAEQVLDIRSRLGKQSERSIAREFNTTPANVHFIHSRKNWAHI